MHIAFYLAWAATTAVLFYVYKVLEAHFTGRQQI